MCQENCGCSEQPNEEILVVSASKGDMKVEIHLNENCTGEQLVEAFKRMYIALDYSPVLINQYFQ